MDGKQVYRFGITKPIENINELLRKSNLTLKDIKYIVPHQSNLKMLKRICKELNIEKQKMYINIQNVGNTFCASIPIALTEMFEKDLLKSGDKIILIGYGGGVNLGSILLEIQLYIYERKIKMKLGFVFPGQGSQFVGMGKDYYEKYNF